MSDNGGHGPRRAPDLSDNTFALMVFLTALSALGSVSVSTYLPAMHAISIELDASLPEVQATLSIYLVGYAIGNLAHGPIADQLGRKPVLIGSSIIYFLAAFGSIFVVSVEQLSALRALQGLAACAGPILGRAIVRDIYDGARMSWAFSVLGMTMGIAPAVGPLIGGVLQGWFNWQASFVFMSAYSGLILLVALAFYRESRPSPQAGCGRPVRMRTTFATLLRNRVFVGWSLSFALGNAGWFVFLTVSPFIFMDRLGVSAMAFGVISMVPIVGFILGNALQRRFMSRTSRLARVRVSFLVILVAPLVMVLTAGHLSIAGVLVPMFVYMMGTGVIMPNHMAYAMEPFPHFAGTASTLLGFAHLSAAALASALGAAIYVDGMFEPALGILGFTVAGTIVVVLTRPWR